jgi:hypothetical protein
MKLYRTGWAGGNVLAVVAMYSGGALGSNLGWDIGYAD